MEKNLLIKLLLDDTKILEKLVCSFDGNINTPEEVEIALNRARTVVKELELLSKNIMTAPAYQPVKVKDSDKSSSEKDSIESDHSEPKEITTSKSTGREKIELQIDKKDYLDGDLAEKKSDNINNHEINLSETKQEIKKDKTIGQKSKTRTLGESLGSNKQVVNDLLGKNSDDSSLISSPLKSIRDGIGINDRFLYIRELFDNDNSKYEEVIRTLDKYSSINDAVDFLKTNFNWNKSDTSEKFLSLIKRKFRNTDV